MESSHFSALQTKHAGLERRILEEMNRPSQGNFRGWSVQRCILYSMPNDYAFDLIWHSPHPTGKLSNSALFFWNNPQI